MSYYASGKRALKPYNVHELADHLLGFSENINFYTRIIDSLVLTRKLKKNIFKSIF